MKTNFRKDNLNDTNKDSNLNDTNKDSNLNVAKKDLTQEEFEDFIVKSGAKGSFMVYRSDKKDDELGMDEL
jgi:hypothetical protein